MMRANKEKEGNLLGKKGCGYVPVRGGEIKITKKAREVNEIVV